MIAGKVILIVSVHFKTTASGFNKRVSRDVIAGTEYLKRQPFVKRGAVAEHLAGAQPQKARLAQLEHSLALK